MIDSKMRRYLSEIGRKGGLKSRRLLDSTTARRMVLLREAQRAYRKHHVQCFWSYDPNYKVKFDDIEWVGRQLIKHGSRELWRLGIKLCR